ncbi:hypothetical protein IW261DRAFT_1467955 [Armillaria novae-zelandiae]|uniref:Uncharacterized protein n=1 Tax=Armillaria novae-zelandiae TaxID=153914 RepID=A0AA39NYM1_9AGAR|nr:hypothetical protein IW261DRAFT_1499962 [Armillaria novae-zelandiae]KAK0482478.1 hypothetical protein IW261DRAFT_1467955 [Armillaria novae-zelandiae]
MQASRLSSTSAHHKKLILGGLTQWIIRVSFILLICAAMYAIAARPTWTKPGTWYKIEEMMNNWVWAITDVWHNRVLLSFFFFFNKYIIHGVINEMCEHVGTFPPFMLSP